MREAGEPAVRLTQGHATDLYWSMAQLLVHHASSGCNLRPGDLLGSGTISGPSKDSRGCLLELTWRGAEPLTLANGETRRFLTSPRNCEVTGVASTPNGRTMFVGIQHPGEPAGDRSNPARPKAISSWPDGAAGGRPRSGTVVVTRIDGGRIGT
jgi:hypothetical protein